MPGKAPSFVRTSLWQTPQACTLMRTCPAPGFGISRSTISNSPPALEICAAFMGAIAIFVVAMFSPLNFKYWYYEVRREGAGLNCARQLFTLTSAVFGAKLGVQ